MFSKKFVLLLSVLVILLIPTLTFGQSYISEKCKAQKQGSYELTVVMSHASFNYETSGWYLAPPSTSYKHRQRSAGHPFRVGDGGGEIWFFDSELLIPVNHGVISHAIVGLGYSTVETDLFIRNYRMDAGGAIVKLGLKFRF